MRAGDRVAAAMPVGAPGNSDPWFCFYEDRPEGEVGLRLALVSLWRNCPGARVVVFVRAASDGFRAWFARRPGGEMVDVSADFPRGWDAKPACLLQLLDRGAPAAVWLDSDLVVTGDLVAWMGRRPVDALVVAEEPPHLSVRGTRCRARALGLPEGRELGFTVNTCLIRVTAGHRPLLEAWRQLLGCADYQREQRERHMLERPFHLTSDQDVLGGLLGSAAWQEMVVGVLRDGREVVHSGGLRFDRLGSQAARCFGRRPLIVHAMAAKPWQLLPGRPDEQNFRWWLLRLAQEVSLYVREAAGLRDETALPCAWLDHRTRSGEFLLAIGLGSSAMRGLMFAAAVALATGLSGGGNRPRGSR